MKGRRTLRERRVIPDTANDFMTIVGNGAVLILGCKHSRPRRAPQFLLFHVAAEPEPSEFLLHSAVFFCPTLLNLYGY
ncbi:unnamed protein product [Lasius platythorax]|uniref:Uncharacterized protein n=1 Tax=Lasius platythorax TaxID=488582 RepID=A0AAV2P303_9HYME